MAVYNKFGDAHVCGKRKHVFAVYARTLYTVFAYYKITVRYGKSIRGKSLVAYFHAYNAVTAQIYGHDEVLRFVPNIIYGLRREYRSLIATHVHFNAAPVYRNSKRMSARAKRRQIAAFERYAAVRHRIIACVELGTALGYRTHHGIYGIESQNEIARRTAYENRRRGRNARAGHLLRGFAFAPTHKSHACRKQQTQYYYRKSSLFHLLFSLSFLRSRLTVAPGSSKICSP